MKENSLIKVKEGMFSRLIKFIKNLKMFKKVKEDVSITNTQSLVEEKKDEEQSEEFKQKTNNILKNDSKEQEIADFEIIERLVKGKIDSNSLDIATQKRIIEMCKLRLMKINKKIEEKKIEEKNLIAYIEKNNNN